MKPDAQPDKQARKFIDWKFIHLEKRRVMILACIFFWSILLCVVLNSWVLGSVTIKGDSMAPTFRHGERRMFHRWVYHLRPPARGEIVVVRDPYDSVKSIKRTVGMPEDEIQIRQGRVFINGEALEEPYLPEGTATLPGTWGSELYEIAKDRYFVLGDNRPVSYDSRTIGAVRRRNILGKVNTPIDRK